jgi:sulfatase maturation enzyme AslB (radical SAM superfamily)
MENCLIKEYKGWKHLRSPCYNYDFNSKTGMFARWGRTLIDDPDFSPFGNEILDIEVSSGGECRAKCDWCYKSNGGGGVHRNMSIDDFRHILGKMPKTLMQIALGITDIDVHPDLVEILEVSREYGVVPNFTTNGLAFDKVDLKKIVSLVGAIAVSVYPHLGKDVCYNAVKKLTGLGLKQTNIHLLYHSENLPFVYEVLRDVKSDCRLERLNAVVLLGLKQRGRAKTGYAPLPQKEFSELVQWCFDNDIPVGFDSCSSAKFEATIKKMDIPQNEKNLYYMMAERCESGLFSAYVSAYGEFFPCSFTEDETRKMEEPIA